VREALLYTIDHSVKIKLTEFSKLKTCTERPSQWTIARTEGVWAEPVVIKLPSVLMFFLFCIIVEHKNTFPFVTI
jgi:hypothetical protein